MTLVEPKLSGRETFQQYDIIRTDFFLAGYQVAYQLFVLKAKILSIFEKNHRQEITENEKDEINSIFNQIVSNLANVRDLDDFHGLDDLIIGIKKQFNEGQYQNALFHMINLIEPKDEPEPAVLMDY